MERPTFDAGLLDATAKSLMQKVVEGFGSDFPKIAYNIPDFEMLRHLQSSVYSFSAAKNWQQLRDMTVALADGDRLRTEKEYRDAVDALNIQYNRNWLQTERGTAIAGGQMASRWVDFERNADAMPMLQYSTVGDGKVRDSHRALDGIIKPIGDPFWNTYYPPNGWNCRCDVIQLPGRDIAPTKDDGIPQVITPMFEANLAKQGLIFPKGHPYFDGIPKPELRRAMAYLPPDNSYTTVKIKGRRTAEVHLLHNDSEVKQNLRVADDLMALGYKNIKLLPDLHEKESALKPQFYPKGYKPRDIRKNPDAWIKSKTGKNMVCDFKTLTSERSFSERITQAAKQAEYAILKLDFEPKKLGISSIERRVDHQMNTNANLKGVIIINRLGKLLYEICR